MWRSGLLRFFLRPGNCSTAFCPSALQSSLTGQTSQRGFERRHKLAPKSMMAGWRELKPSIVFECEDCHATYHLLKDRGVVFAEGPKKMPWGTYAKFQDTDGNEFMLKGP